MLLNMRQIVHDIKYGTSEPQKFQLVDRGTPITRTGLDITISVASRVNGLNYTLDPQPLEVDWSGADADGGEVTVTGSEDLPLGNYHVEFILTDSGGKQGSVPTVDEYIFRVTRTPSNVEPEDS